MLSGIFLFHLACVFYLLIIMRKGQRLMTYSLEQDGKKMLNKAQCKLYIILLVFNSTFATRAYYDFKASADTFDLKTLLLELGLSVCWDFIPVMMMLIFHYRNFKLR